MLTQELKFRGFLNFKANFEDVNCDEESFECDYGHVLEYKHAEK